MKRLRFISNLWLLPFILFFGFALSCNDRMLTQYLVVKEFTQAAVKQIDLLIVVDNSTSMAEENPLLQAGADALITKLTESDGDLRIGILTMNTRDQTASGIADQAGILQATAASNGVSILSTEEMDAAEIIQNFKDILDRVQTDPNLTTNTVGRGCEEGLEAAKLALDSGLNLNPDFHRPGAHVAIIFMTDEDSADVNPDTTPLPDPELRNDLCPTANSSSRVFPRDFSTVDEYLNFFANLTSNNFSIHGFVTLPWVSGNDPVCQAQMPTVQALEESTNFLDAIDTTSGFRRSICEPDYAAVTDELGLAIAQLSAAYFVNIPVDAATLVITVDDVEVNSADFTLINNNRTILFDQDKIPAAGANVVIRFLSDLDLVPNLMN